MREKALLIDDDRDLCELLSRELQGPDLDIDYVHNGTSGLERAKSGGYQLVVLDMMLPGLNGAEVCRGLRAHDQEILILVLSSKGETPDKVHLLDIGADDYLTKPFSVSELRARMKALLRRQRKESSSASRSPRSVICGELSIHLDAGIVELRGEPINLTSGEFQIIALLASELGKIFSREEIVTAVHGVPLRGYDAAVMTHISRIRAKIEKKPADPEYLKTVQGLGYKLVDPTARHSSS